MRRSGTPALYPTGDELGELHRALLAIYEGRGYPPPYPQEIVVLQHFGEQVPWARARTDKGHYFTSKRSAGRGATYRQLLRLAMKGRPPFAGAVAMAAIFRMPDARWTDGDNLVKLVLDAGTKVELWRDDSHVTAVLPYLELDRENPRSLFAFAPARSSIPRYPEEIDGARACVHCGCTAERACNTTPGGCDWSGPHLCSVCEGLGFRG